MLQLVTSKWWAFLIRGIAAILFGILAVFWPKSALEVFVLLFGAFVLIDGFFAGWAGLAARRYSKSWWILLLEGLLGIAVGLITLFQPGITMFVLYTFIAIWAILTGIFELVQAVRLRRKIRNEWMLVLGGILSVALGAFLLLRPESGALVLIWMIAFYALLFGFLFVSLSLKMRNLKGSVKIEIEGDG